MKTSAEITFLVLEIMSQPVSSGLNLNIITNKVETIKKVLEVKLKINPDKRRDSLLNRFYSHSTDLAGEKLIKP